MERYICIHGHFYQPPRENAWLGYIEVQDQAYPYHDWNEKINAECYQANASSRILDDKGFITGIVCNYSKMSFNFGPTLLAWMENNAPDVYQAIIEADRESRKNFSGHGSAMAQAYNHIIMPLANHRDRYSQVLWGIKDFEYRFGRQPEGMWLPETAVDLETLDILAELGIRFTILSPHQARRIRPIGDEKWRTLRKEAIDTTRAYLINLPSGRNINVFFFNGPISRAVAFSDTLKSGEKFAQALMNAFAKREQPQLMHIANDGETYGHHHRFADMALAYAVNYIEANKLAEITNYGEYLEKFPPVYEVEIREKTSWSCSHGIDRWWSDCGDSDGGHPTWNQKWRTPLRNAMDRLRDTVAGQYDENARQYLKDPWAARDGYIDVILDRSPGTIDKFLARYATHELAEAEKITVLKLLEMQRHAMLMYTSCGWFFDDLSRIETLQVIQYAGRVAQLAEELFGSDVEGEFLQILEQAESNISAEGNGRNIYEKYIRPAMVDFDKVAAHYAISSLFEEYDKETVIYSFSIYNEDYQTAECGKSRLAVGKIKIVSEITGESVVRCFGVFHFGDHVINAGICEYKGEEAYREMVNETTRACTTADFTEVIRLLDRHFGGAAYSLKSLFRDEQRKILNYILESTLFEIETAYRQLYEHHYPPMRFLSELGTPLPKAFRSAAELVINTDLHRAVGTDILDIENIHNLVNTAESLEIEIDIEGIGYELKGNLESLMTAFAEKPEDIDILETLISAVSLALSTPFDVDLWKLQNLYWEMLQSNYPVFKQEAEQGDSSATEWVERFVFLGEQLHIKIA